MIDTYKISIQSFPLHDQSWQIFGLLHATSQKNDHNLQLFQTLWPEVKLKVIHTGLEI